MRFIVERENFVKN